MDHFVAKRRRFAGLLVGVVALAAIFGAIGVYLLPGVTAGRLESRYPVRVELGPKVAAAVRSRPAIDETASDTGVETVPGDAPAAAQDASPEPTARALPSQVASDPAGLLAVEFDLSPDPGLSAPAGRQLEVTKPLIVNGREAGSIAVRVGRNSQLYLDRPGLARALRQVDGGLAEAVAGGTQPFVSFDELRAGGLAVRYDPVADGVRLEK